MSWAEQKAADSVISRRRINEGLSHHRPRMAAQASALGQPGVVVAPQKEITVMAFERAPDHRERNVLDPGIQQIKFGPRSNRSRVVVVAMCHLPTLQTARRLCRVRVLRRRQFVERRRKVAEARTCPYALDLSSAVPLPVLGASREPYHGAPCLWVIRSLRLFRESAAAILEPGSLPTSPSVAFAACA